jgi:hypothetical protein
MNHFYTSREERVAKSVIDSRVRKAKGKALEEQHCEFGYNFCVDCLVSSGVYLDCSHTISVDEAQKTRRAELAWDVKNIKVRCRACHQKHDNL